MGDSPWPLQGVAVAWPLQALGRRRVWEWGRNSPTTAELVLSLETVSPALRLQAPGLAPNPVP